MEGCIFCKIAKGEIPCSKVYEDDSILAFLDVAPVHKGHTLIIPKEHYMTILDTPEETMLRIAPLLRKIAAAVKASMKCDGINICQNNFRPAGQLVDHIHFHIIPRFEGDGLKTWPQGEYKEGEMEETLEKLKSSLDES